MSNLDIPLEAYPHLRKLVSNTENNGYLDYYPDCEKAWVTINTVVSDNSPVFDANFFNPLEYINGLTDFNAQHYERELYEHIQLVKANSNLSKTAHSVQELHSQIQSTNEINNVVVSAYKLASGIIYTTLKERKETLKTYNDIFNFVAGSLVAAAAVATGGAGGVVALAASAGITVAQDKVSAAVKDGTIYGLTKIERKLMPELTCDEVDLRFDYTFETMKVQNLTSNAINEIYRKAHHIAKKAIKSSLYLLAFQKKEFHKPESNEDIYRRHKAYYSGAVSSRVYSPALDIAMVNAPYYLSAIYKLICLEYCVRNVGTMSDTTIRTIMKKAEMTSESKSYYQAITGKYKDSHSMLDARLDALTLLTERKTFDTPVVQTIDHILSDIPIGGRIDQLKRAQEQGETFQNTLQELLSKTMLAGISITKT